MYGGSRAAEDDAYFIFCPSKTRHHVPFSKTSCYSEQETENEFPFLEEVYTPPSQSKIEYGSFLIFFVFVHGLNPRGRSDHPYETWRHQNGTFWPRDYLPQDIPHARVFVYGYNSNVTNPQAMSTASVKDHANTLLNLLDMERSPQLSGGLVIKQALLNAHEDPKYTAIRLATCGLVFFGTPHRGAKGVEVGKIAAKVARFVSKGHASNELLDCLEYNSLFTRQMSSRFSHQLEDYRVVSFVEGKEVLIGGAGPASVSHLVVDEESAVLGLPGNRETRLKLDADHSQMCKIGSRGPMYKLIKGNIKQIVDQVLVAEQGYIPQQSTSPHPGPPLPPRMHTNSSSPYPSATPQTTAQRIVGTMYVAADSDPRSIQAAEHKNAGRWDQARNLEYAIFQEHLRTLGPDHNSTIVVGYNLAEIDLEASYLAKATEWCKWVSDQGQRILGPRHPLTLRAESLMGEILCARGRYQESESVCANVLARQQMNIGDDDLDTLETRRRLSMAYSNLGQEQNAINIAEKRHEALQRILGPQHIRVLASALDTVEVVITSRTQNAEKFLEMRFSGEIANTTAQTGQIAREVTDLLGPRHPLSLRALRLQGILQMLQQDSTTASETLRRALAIAEETLGPDHTESMALVATIGIMYTLHSDGGNYITSDVQSMLDMLAQLHLGRQQYTEASKYYERLVESYQAAGMAVPSLVQTNLQTCRTHTMLLTQYSSRGAGSAIEGILNSFVKKRF
ncbi:LipA and NB-ARC domain protein [Aspergillus novofumigatus IBT 16806]|uniref:Tetratricopeptide repeat domain protein n=1 Tax=Aspergillus novofumigatus (strain IBT 16806) TaxID=1392255 RepID=A0A2I1BTN4_ASPN1|nr:tetratricopeptide repeat domain protein [Aspergillus novofumigatus IBT 16806]PKX88712.1 tetratricopeptide repeat domain protein [Aspergillus novofumigatus IBT 16806]